MKKLFSIVLLGLMMLTTSQMFAEKQKSQKHTTELVKQINNFNEAVYDFQDPFETAKKLVKYNRESRKDATQNASTTTSRTVINCHTDYNLSDGSACVSVNGEIYIVYWGHVGDFTVYNPVKVSRCNC